VAQWGIAYAAAAWGVLQGLAYVTTTFHWPEQIQQFSTVALLLGLPVVLVLAWYHGDRGEQRVTPTEFAILTLLFLVGGAIFWRYERADIGAPGSSPPAAAPATATADARPSIAVLPFENRSDQRKDAFFVDGIHDDILTQLAKIGAMKVIARTSVEQFRDTRLTTSEIGAKLGVKTVLEGGVQRAGDRVRIHVQLIDAQTDAHLWAESYDRELTAANVFAIQSEVASAIADALKATLTPAELERAKAVPTQNLAAWEAYQLGKQRLAKRTSADLGDAERFFREAIALDPAFALAYVGLADTLTVQILYSGAPRQSGLGNAEKAVAAALELDRNLAEAWASSGLIARGAWQYDRAEAMFRRAIELNPNYAPARHWYSITLSELGRPDEALAQIERAAELDPLSAVINETLGEALVGQGGFRDAVAAFRKAITIDPARPGPYLGVAFLHAYALNRFVDAVPFAQKALELDPGSPGPVTNLALLYLDLDDDDRSFATIAPAAKRWPDSMVVAITLAMVNLVRMDNSGAARLAQRVVDADPRDVWSLAILRNADLQNGRYDAALERYAKAYPELRASNVVRVDGSNYQAAIDLALVAQKRGDSDWADALLDGAAGVMRTFPRLGVSGYWIEDVQIHALRGLKAQALAALRQAEQAGWRGPIWRYFRDIEPDLASIRNEPEFKAIFADIERDIAQQRAELAGRAPDAALNLDPPP
jgi:TolB-like protein/Tfp pilus assembly protein PilF